MISYLDNVKKIVDIAIYNRGIKLYLDGEVSKPKDMSLDHWRLYSVRSNADYSVKIPLLHLVLNSKNFNKADQAIQEVATCDCEYFITYGICQHIVAVCASIDKEFGQSSLSTFDKLKDSGTSVLDSIFEAEKVKKHRKWLEIIEMYLSRINQNYFYLDEITKTIVDEPLDHDDFLLTLKKIADSVVGMYTKEKYLITIIIESILVGKKIWWDFWLPYLFKFDERNQVRLFVGLWKIRWMSGGKTYQAEFERLLSRLKKDEKKQIFDQLKIEFSNQREIWLEFCFVSQYYDWLEENIDTLDPFILVRLCLNLPEKRENYEYKILNQVKIWADFLQTGRYAEIINFFQYWQHALGRSEVFEDAITYFKLAHPKKKKLLKGLGSY